MANLEVEDVPDALHERLRSYARKNRCTISAAVLAAVERELALWEWRESMARRPETDIRLDAATLIAEERLGREGEIESRVRLALYGAGEDAGDEEALQREEDDDR